jgi:hypothetical protein
MITPSAGAGGRELREPGALPLPQGLPGLPPRPRVLQLIDGDCVSHGMAGWRRLESGRASDRQMCRCLARLHATAKLLDPRARVLCAVSKETAAFHIDVLFATRNNSFTIRRGLNGADWALLEELNDLISACRVASRPGRRRPVRTADLVILVGNDKIYAAAVTKLRGLGTPTWLVVPGRQAGAALSDASCAVSFIG